MGYKEIAAGKIKDFKDNGMRTLDVDGSKILIARTGDEIYAVSAKCTHYGGPLEKGALSGGKIVCPWHHACFDLKTGGILEPPAMDALQSYDVIKDGENLIVRIPEDAGGSRMPHMAVHEPDADGRTFVIIGAGAAGYAACQALRENNFKGRIMMITREHKLPYDRPNLSKDYLRGEAKPEWMPLRPAEFYEKYGIELVFGKDVISLEAGSRSITLGNGTVIEYDKALIATGGRARELAVPGSGLGNIFKLRSFHDADVIKEAARHAQGALIIGSSFIGMETAYSLSELGLAVTVVGKDSVPYESIFGKEIGVMFLEEHEKRGVVFEMEKNVSKFFGDGKVEKVLLSDGREIAADLVITGIGVIPETGFISDIVLNPDGSVPVDRYLCAADGVFAAGDIASYPDWRAGKRSRIEHWRVAQQQGRAAAGNMLDMEIQYTGVPFFWTAQAGLDFRYVGHAETWDRLITWGSIEERDFITFFVGDGMVLAAGGNNRDTEIAAVEELLRLHKMPWPEELEKGTLDLQALLEE